MASFDILVAGEINPDLILSGDVVPEFGQVEKLVDSASLNIGSSSVIFACAASRLELKVAFIGVCGDDFFGNYMLAQMNQYGIDTSAVIVDPHLATGLSVILSRPNDRAILTHSGAISALRAADISDDLLRRARHLHVASYFLQDALRPGLGQLFRRAHELDLTTSLDTNWDPTGQWVGIHSLLPLTDIFLPNSQEAIAITGCQNDGEALKVLARQSRTVAMKRGASGALACRGEETASAAALSGKVVDTVGAGDTFDAGFIYGCLNDWSLAKSLWLASVCGSLSTRAAGGTSAQPTLAEAMQHVPPA